MIRKTNNNILVPTDFSDVAENASSHAVTVAKAYGNEITLLYILEEGILGGLFSGSQSDVMRDAIQVKLETKAKDIAEKNNVKVHALVDKGKVYKTIAGIANSNNYRYNSSLCWGCKSNAYFYGSEWNGTIYLYL